MNLERITIENNLEFLRQISEEVDLSNDNYMEWVNLLKDYCKNHVVYAMAPVQIGIPKRMIYIKNTTQDMTNNKDSNYDESIVLINPVIKKSEGHTRFLEACESCLDFVATIDRPYKVEVEYYDINGNKKHEIFEGFKATVFCHEYDHLNGIIHLDLSDEISIMNLDARKIYRENHPYEIISKEEEFSMEKRKIKQFKK